MASVESVCSLVSRTLARSSHRLIVRLVAHCPTPITLSHLPKCTRTHTLRSLVSRTLARSSHRLIVGLVAYCPTPFTLSHLPDIHTHTHASFAFLTLARLLFTSALVDSLHTVSPTSLYPISPTFTRTCTHSSSPEYHQFSPANGYGSPESFVSDGDATMVSS
jgi:hypothetical protein